MSELKHQCGFGNLHATEAVPSALPQGQNSPQRAPRGLYAEVLSGSAFTAPRAENFSAWLYKLRPSAMHAPFRRIANGLLRSGPFNEAETSPNRRTAPSDTVRFGMIGVGMQGSGLLATSIHPSGDCGRPRRLSRNHSPERQSSYSGCARAAPTPQPLRFPLRK